MNQRISRRAFASGAVGSLGIALPLCGNCGAPAEATKGPAKLPAAAAAGSSSRLNTAVPKGPENFPALTVRPYQLLCVICRRGGGCSDDLGNPGLTNILRAVQKDRKQPLVLRMNADTVYRYQNPGHEHDTPEGELYNAKRDLDVLQKLGLVPGDARPAIDMFERVFTNIPTVAGICGYPSTTSTAWRGCPRAASGDYEKGHARGLAALLPQRDPADKALVKKESAAAIYQAKPLEIRPHHLLCMSCFFGGRYQKLAPISEDNLFEAIDAIHKNPQVPVKLIAGCCMICPPCGKYDPASKLCLGGRSMALRDQKKDLDVLQRLGLSYGDTLPGVRLYERLFERIASTREICGYGDGRMRAPEWSICSGAEKDDAYQKARKNMLAHFGFKPDPA